MPDSSRPTRAPSVEGVLWALAAVAVTLGLFVVRQRVSTAHVALLYLLVVLGASARRGRRVGLVLAGACFVAFNVLFVQPYGTLAVHDPLDLIVLLAFLATSTVATQLLHRAQTQADAARARALEVQRLAMLGAEALQAPRAEEAAAAVARVVREELGMAECELYRREDGSDEVHLVARATASGSTLPDELTARRVAELVLGADQRTLILPLEVHDRAVGLLVLRANSSISPGIARQSFVESLEYYAALSLERIRLTRAAQHADALREADKLKDSMLSAVSHDLRTPLTTIKAVAHEIAASGDERGEDIEAEADRLNRYVTNLLDLSRLNAHAIPVQRELVPIDDLFAAVLQQHPQAKYYVHVVLGDDWPSMVLSCDFVLTVRVLANLVDNALRHASGTPVELRAVRHGAEIALDVMDRGPGVAAAERERIFEPFHRGRAEKGDGGAGLGLAIARQLTLAQGGRIALAARDGGGSVFTVTLAAAEPIPAQSL